MTTENGHFRVAGRAGRKRLRDIAVDWFGEARAAFERPPPRPGPNSGAGYAPAPRPLERRGRSIRDEAPSLDLERDDGFEPIAAAAVHFRIATGHEIDVLNPGKVVL